MMAGLEHCPRSRDLRKEWFAAPLMVFSGLRYTDAQSARRSINLFALVGHSHGLVARKAVYNAPHQETIPAQ